jgi:AraC family transcriptional regulator of adaptative response/methylated-DNA-[protein]-cysteine methyltransferase
LDPLEQLSKDYYQIERAIQLLGQSRTAPITNQQIAAAIGRDELALERLFRRWALVDTQKFMQYLTKAYAKGLVRDAFEFCQEHDGSKVPDAGRLFNLIPAFQAVESGLHFQKGTNMDIHYGVHATPFGHCLLAICSQGICNLHFAEGQSPQYWESWLQNYWPSASLHYAPQVTASLITKVFSHSAKEKSGTLYLYAEGSRFQVAVWDALLKIPSGQVVTYEGLARHVGSPDGARAVGNAVGKNPIAFLIPCHRVIRKSGEFGHYGGGKARKKAMLGWEAAQSPYRPLK